MVCIFTTYQSYQNGFSPPQETAQKGLKEKRIEKRSINQTYQRDFNQNIIQTHRFATFSARGFFLSKSYDYHPYVE